MKEKEHSNTIDIDSIAVIIAAVPTSTSPHQISVVVFLALVTGVETIFETIVFF